jgi:AraC-like DNA-binding protein
MIGTAKLNFYLKALQPQGIQPEALLSGTGIALNHLSDPRYLVDIDQYQLVIANMIGLTGNYALGLSLLKEITFADMGIFGYATMSATTIQDSIELWRTYSRPLFGIELDIQLESDELAWHLTVDQSLPPGPVYQFFVEEFILLMNIIGRLVSGRDIVFEQIEVNYPAPAHADHYRQLCHCPVLFSAERNRFSVSSPRLNELQQNRDPSLNAHYRKFCARMHGGTEESRPLLSRIMGYLLSCPNQMPSIQQAAKYLNTSERSLRRRLAEEDTTYRQLVNRYRRDIAKEYLTTTHFSATEIAEILGYQDSKPFLRAFKEWTGLTPGQYRSQHRQ